MTRGERMRVRFLFMALGCVPVFLAGWFGWLQVLQAGELSRGSGRTVPLVARTADWQRDRKELLPGPRGTITDRHGATMAIDCEAFEVRAEVRPPRKCRRDYADLRQYLRDLTARLVDALTRDPGLANRGVARRRLEHDLRRRLIATFELEGKADLVIPLTHLGVEHDVELARAHPEVPLIVGGHSHTFLREPVIEGETRIVQAGSKAGAVGRVDFWIDRRTHAIERVEARLVDLYDEPLASSRNRAVELACGRLVRQSSARQDEVVGELATPAERGRDFRSSSAGNWIVDHMRAQVSADVAIHNRGGIRRALPAGPITRRMLFEILPFDNTVVVLDVSGADLRESLRRAVEDREHSGVEFSGLRVEVRVDAEGHGQLGEVWVGEQALVEDARYSLATNSFLASGGDGYFAHLADNESTDTGILLRECLERAFDASSIQTPPADERYSVRGSEQ